jgi:F-type H+-transporting ATPase subunit epsilon
MAETFHISVITPERAVLEAEATFAAFPAHDGEVGVLHGRAPFLFKLGAGLLRVDGPDGKETLFIAGGFAQMVNNRLTLLTEQAKDPAKIDRAEAEKALAAALAMKGTDEAAYRSREQAVAAARAQVRVARMLG